VWLHPSVLAVVFAVAAGAVVVAAVANLWPAPLAQPPAAVVPVAAALGVVALAAGDAAPTGWQPFDLVLRAALGAAVPLAAARARSAATAWLALIAAATGAVADASAGWVAGLALGAMVALVVAGSSSGPARALIAAAALVPLAHLDWAVATGAGGAAVAVAAAPVLVVGLLRGPRVVRTVAAVAVVVAAVGSALGAVAALSVRADLDDAVGAASDGLDLLGDDDDAARDRLAEAAGAFERAERRLRAWWARPALAVPGVAHQSRAVATMARSGADLARTAVSASAEADLDRVRPRDGQVDLVALADLAGPLDRSLASLDDAARQLARVDHPLLVAPIATRLADLRDRVDDALTSAEVAAQAVEVAPALLGADGPRRYFIAVQNPAEIRGSGGFMGSWAEMVVDGGRFELTGRGRVKELNEGGVDPAGRRIEGEAEFVARYGQLPAQFLGLIGFSPDFPTVGRILAQVYPEAGGAPIDGVIGITPTALAAFLEITGPVDVPGYPEPFDAGNVERILLHEQYIVFPEDIREERAEFLGEVTEVLFDRLMERELPGPSELARRLGPAVESRHLQLWAAEPAEQALFEVIGADGSAQRRDADAFGVVVQNAGGSKIDWFLRRTLRYEAAWDPGSGAVEGTITAHLRNEAPTEGLPRIVLGNALELAPGEEPLARGESFLLTTVYSTFPIASVSLDGEPVGFLAGTELGHHTAQLYVRIPSGGTRELRAEVGGRVAPGDRYRVTALRQPTVVADRLEVSLTVPDGWRVVGAPRAEEQDRRVERTWPATVDRDLVVDVQGARSVLDRLRGAR
jgi:hypothetical protein